MAHFSKGVRGRSGIAATLLTLTLLLTGCPSGDGEPVDEPEQEQGPVNPGQDEDQGNDQDDDQGSDEDDQGSDQDDDQDDDN